MQIAVYGLGRFGSFWASLLSKSFQVKGYSRNPDRMTPEGVLRVSLEELMDCHVLFLCNAISSMEQVLPVIAPLLKPGTLVVDTCSVKVYPVDLMKKYLPDSVEILGSHPMFGPDSGKNGVQGLPIVLCKERIKDDHYILWKDHFRNLGLMVQEMTAHEHDREAAYTQGITHFIGRTLDALNLHPSSMATAGYERLLDIVTQTCNDPWQLFIDLQKYNPYTSRMRQDLHKGLEKMLGTFDSIESLGVQDGRNSFPEN
ncbi:prephenate dehydrogenase/arogenate dehydrogenase family protein [Oceanispirochaeta sp.]|uniref:prephenate dehydrogenase/arogenate dehydrogenase family protein n=1 Tax=Oceanispirochaeta sp. TaxID=2035350 RepID=UPI00262291C0|nr:prephenate dehydrogenase/arogenate dehydrogenase family protein [Oceanispirochaeta sp.]MDA3956414.1 prephenate dehydrogenase/arogenate dehydrogenase family protein [Oceanispirochaeta sp.]